MIHHVVGGVLFWNHTMFATLPSLLPWLTALIVLATIIGIATGRWPWLRADRTTIVLIGSALLLASGAMSLDQAFAAIDVKTILLLFSMMVINANLYTAGFFGVVAQRVIQIAHGPRMLLAFVIAAAGVLSALFLNDTVVLMLTPLVLDTTRALKRNPIPYLIGLATGANVGSAATITGNPQNIIIGNASRIAYLDFAAALTPISLIGLLVCWLVIILSYRNEFHPVTFDIPSVSRTAVVPALLWKSMIVIPAMLVLFFIGIDIAVAAFLAAGALLATRRIKPERIFRQIDWNLLAFFCGLFVVTGALDIQGLTTQLFTLMAPIAQAGLIPFGLVTALLSNLISNVPAVLVLQGLIPALPDPQRGWLMLAAASTLAGNLTLLGSVANLIVVELAARWGVRLSFEGYLRAGIPITLLTLFVAFLMV
jgi:Na+/H+ antiporter NhaD/arsenite permease-like protein